VDPDGGLKWSVATGASTPRGLAIGADGTLFVGTSKMNGVGQFIGGTLFAIHPDGSTKWELNGYPFGEIAIGGDRTVYSMA
jgi:outer membrane protein assembly factor BamB